MKFTLILLLLAMLSLPASAQWYYRIGLKKAVRYPAIAQIKNNPLKRLPVAKIVPVKIAKYRIPDEYDYELDAQEAAVMKIAQHNMRFRIYDIASYNFSQLAKMFMKQNRFSEAKWYLLQSNNISRQQNDDGHTIANLMDLAMVKANLGDLQQSQQDLDEARQIATARGFQSAIADIEKESIYIKLNKNASSPKLELKYASDAMVTDKKTADKKTD